MSDQTLVQEILEGSNRAFELLVMRYQNPVAGFIWRIVPLAEDREEVCQDVFVKVYQNLAGFKSDSKFSTWLYSIAWRTAISRVRKKSLDTLPLEISDHPSVVMEAGVERDQLAGVLATLIARLAPEDRAAVTLYHMQGCSVEEIGEIMEKPAGTIKSILFRARKRLKDSILLEHGEIF
ncbi:MAG: RNA polymerase sigma factor [Pseudomonadota bacterium]